MDDRDLLRYSRHILLDEIGIEGQEKLLSSAALVIGCGGLGAAALPFLAAAGVGRLIWPTTTKSMKPICSGKLHSMKATSAATRPKPCQAV